MVELNEMINLSGTGDVVQELLIFLFIFIIIAVMLAIGLVKFFKWKKYRDYKCVIWDVSGGNFQETYDRAGIFEDKALKQKRFYLEKGRVGLPPDKVPYLPVGKKSIVYLAKYGLKDYRFINIKLQPESVKFNVTEEDVNWATEMLAKTDRLFDFSSWKNWLPFIVMAVVAIGIIIMVIYVVRNFDVLKDVALALRQTAEIMAQKEAGTVVVSG